MKKLEKHEQTISKRIFSTIKIATSALIISLFILEYIYEEENSNTINQSAEIITRNQEKINAILRNNLFK